MEWTEDHTTYDLATNRYVRHMEYEDAQLFVGYSRVLDDIFNVHEIKTADGTDITPLVKDRVIQRLENIIERTSK